MRLNRSGFRSAHRPVMPKLPRIPLAASVSRISAVYPASDPASKLNATTFRLVSPFRITCAGPPVVGRVSVGAGDEDAGDGVAVTGCVGENVGRAVRLGAGVTAGLVTMDVSLPPPQPPKTTSTATSAVSHKQRQITRPSTVTTRIALMRIGADGPLAFQHRGGQLYSLRPKGWTQRLEVRDVEGTQEALQKRI